MTIHRMTIRRMPIHRMPIRRRPIIAAAPQTPRRMNPYFVRPCIRGMRITVYDVLDYLASDMTEAEILEDFPDLTHEDIRACLAFAADRERKLLMIVA
jgi:uncharacterized protein (DUF433 family)